MKKCFRRILIIFILLIINKFSFSQNTYPNKFLEWTSWTLMQTIPSPVFYQDSDEYNSRLQFGLRWNIIPVNYSFTANKLVSPVQFFKVNPVRRNAGSLELFLQPEWATSNFEYSDLNRFNLAAGARVYIPAVDCGEYLALSVGGKYNVRKNVSGNNDNYYSVEAGIYTFFGICGLIVNYNFNFQSRYNIGLNLKYY